MSPVGESIDLPRQLGPYTLLRRIAVGGMAEVYVARTQGLGGFEKKMAIKVIHPRHSKDEKFIRMLVEEAKISALLVHHNIVQIFDLGCIEGTYFIVMEYIEGADTYRLVRRASGRGLPLPIDVCVHIALEVCSGLEYAHGMRGPDGKPLGIVHRDISPQNVLVSFAGEVKILDFGIAKAALRNSETDAGVIKGSYYYMSPEQGTGAKTDARSDIFSAGAVLYELLVGDTLYARDNIAVLLERVRSAEFTAPMKRRKGIPKELNDIVVRALARKPEDRYQSAREMGDALKAFLYKFSPAFTPVKLADCVAQFFADEREGNRGEKSSSATRLKGLGKVPRMRAPFFRSSSAGARSEEGAEVGAARSEGRVGTSRNARGETVAIGAPPEARRPEAPSPERRPARLNSAEFQMRQALSQGTPLASVQKSWDNDLTVANESRDVWDDSTVVDASDEEEEKTSGTFHAISSLPPRSASARDTASLRARGGATARRSKPIPRVSQAVTKVGATRPTLPHGPVHSAAAESALAETAAYQAPAGTPSRSGGSVQTRREGGAMGSAALAAAPSLQASSASTVAFDSLAEQEQDTQRVQAAAVLNLAPAPKAEPFSAAAPWNPLQASAAQAAPTPVYGYVESATWEVSTGNFGTYALPKAPPGKLRRLIYATGALAMVAALLVASFYFWQGRAEEGSTLRIVSVPPGANAMIDGKPLSGKTPLEFQAQVVRGKVSTLKLQLDGYDDWETTFQAGQGLVTQIAVMRPKLATLTIETQPPGAHVWVNGTLYGRAPIELKDLPAGRRIEVRAAAVGFTDSRQVVEIRQEESRPRVHLTLSKARRGRVHR